MSMVVRTNSMAMSANSALNKNNSTVAGNLQKLSTGFRINRAADDASGLAVSEKMKAQIKALDQAGKNAQDGASLIKTAEGYMGEIHDMLNRIVELAEKSANGTYETKDGETYGAGKAGTDRQAIQDEVDQLTTEIDRIASTANFNQLKLLDGSMDSSNKGTTTTTKFFGAVEGSTPQYYSEQDASKTIAAGTEIDAAATYYTKTDTEESFSEAAKITEDQYNTAKAAGNLYNADHTAQVTEAYDADTQYTIKTPASTEWHSVSGADVVGSTSESTTEGAGKALKLQIGETSGKADKLEVSIMSFKTSDLLADLKDTTVEGGTEKIVVDNASAAATSAGITGLTFNVSNQDAASLVAEKVRTVINNVSSQRATLGAMENRLDYTMNNLDTASQNITDANSRIRDTDMAKTMMEYTQGNTLTQAAQAMLAQANQAPSQVLQLLQ